MIRDSASVRAQRAQRIEFRIAWDKQPTVRSKGNHRRSHRVAGGYVMHAYIHPFNTDPGAPVYGVKTFLAPTNIHILIGSGSGNTAFGPAYGSALWESSSNMPPCPIEDVKADDADVVVGPGWALRPI